MLYFYNHIIDIFDKDVIDIGEPNLLALIPLGFREEDAPLNEPLSSKYILGNDLHYIEVYNKVREGSRTFEIRPDISTVYVRLYQNGTLAQHKTY